MNKRYVFNDDHVEILCDICFKEIERPEKPESLVMQVTPSELPCENCEELE